MSLLGLIGLAAAGLAGMSAKDKNEKAQRINNKAQQLHNSVRESLIYEKSVTESSIQTLGKRKKAVLQTSVAQFLKSYKKIGNVQFQESVGIDEIQNFYITEADVLHLQEMTDIYDKAFSTGAAVGVVTALAMGTDLAVISSGIATGGAVLAAGEIGAASTAFGAAIAPLATIVAPVAVFTAFSASLEADTNLQKANENYAKAELAAEKMKTEQVKCEAIRERTEIFDGLLTELNDRFVDCVSLMDAVIRKKTRWNKNKKITFTKEEKKLIYVTGALAKAVKSVIDTPILSNGRLTDESEEKADELRNALPVFNNNTEKIKAYDFGVKPKKVRTFSIDRHSKTIEWKTGIKKEIIRDIIGLIASALCICVLPFDIFLRCMIGSLVALCIMHKHTSYIVIDVIKWFIGNVLNVSWLGIFIKYALPFAEFPHHTIVAVLTVILAFVVYAMIGTDIDKIFENENSAKARILDVILVVSVIIAMFCLAFLMFNFLYWFTGWANLMRFVVGFFAVSLLIIIDEVFGVCYYHSGNIDGLVIFVIIASLVLFAILGVGSCC